MARIRTVKPGYPKHRKVRRVSRDARLLNIHLWNLADDEGRLQELPNWILGEVFPTDDDIDVDVLKQLLDELSEAGLIVRYEVDGEKYIYSHDFREHQVINKPRPSELPPPPEPNPDDSGSPPVVVPDDSRGEKEKEGKRKGNETTSTGKPSTADAQQVFDTWVEATGKNPNLVRFSDDRKDLIIRRLKDWPLDDLLDAVRGWRHSPHHRGDNDRGRPYNDLSLLLRNTEKIEGFRDLERAHRSKPQARSGLPEGFVP